MKIWLFTDAHLTENRLNNISGTAGRKAEERINCLIEVFKKECCDIIINLWDTIWVEDKKTNGNKIWQLCKLH